MGIENINMDSPYISLDEAIAGKDIPDDIHRTLSLFTVPYVSFDDIEAVKYGQLVMHSALAEEVRAIFEELVRLRFPIARIIPVRFYDWDDDASMEANNTSAFNYRKKPEKDELSNHSYGWALDINPRLNPFISRSNTVYPSGAVYDLTRPGTITPDGPVVHLFKSRGWIWGGDWIEVKDYQHFEKPM